MLISKLIVALFAAAPLAHAINLTPAASPAAPATTRAPAQAPAPAAPASTTDTVTTSAASTTATASTEVTEGELRLPSPSRNFNARVNPLMVLGGGWNIDLDVGVAESVTVGPTIAYLHAQNGGKDEMTGNLGSKVLNQYDSEANGWGFGVRANFYPRHKRFQTGWMISPYIKLYKAHVTGNRNSAQIDTDVNGQTYGLLAVWQHYFNANFNMNTGVGLAYWAFPTSVQGKGQYADASVPMPGVQGLLPTLDVSFGYVF